MENSASSSSSQLEPSTSPAPKIDISRNIHPKIFKVIVLGDSNVGKTSLTYRFCEGKFLENAEATIGVDFRSRTLDIDGEEIQLYAMKKYQNFKCQEKYKLYLEFFKAYYDSAMNNLQLWDTAGQERFRTTMVRHYYRNAHAIILVYDVTNASSFHSIKKWVDECNQNCLYDIPRILVGNKCDGITAVTTNVAQRLADQYNMPLFETSARLDSQCDNVDAIFMTLAHKLKNQKPFLPTQNIRVEDTNRQDKSSSSGCC